jgi:hypothetical protein
MKGRSTFSGLIVIVTVYLYILLFGRTDKTLTNTWYWICVCLVLTITFQTVFSDYKLRRYVTVTTPGIPSRCAAKNYTFKRVPTSKRLVIPVLLSPFVITHDLNSVFYHFSMHSKSVRNAEAKICNMRSLYKYLSPYNYLYNTKMLAVHYMLLFCDFRPCVLIFINL